MNYIVGEDEQGKFVKFDKDGVQATLRFEATYAADAMTDAKRILYGVVERIVGK